ncbi:Ras family [Phytophthora infestans]|nr:Ras family [Phytophthora infestans]
MDLGNGTETCFIQSTVLSSTIGQKSSLRLHRARKARENRTRNGTMADAGNSKAREVKVVLLGDTGVGKSSLVLRFVTNNFRPYSESTIGASFMSKMIVVNDTPIKYQIWDTAGQEKYHSLAPMYYRGAAAAIVVYDITRKQSLTTLKNWVKELKQLGPDNIVIAIAGNKSDLEEKREVPASQARAYAGEIGALFIETSAKEDTNVSDLFIQISQALPTASAESNALPEIVDPYGGGKKKSSGCC